MKGDMRTWRQMLGNKANREPTSSAQAGKEMLEANAARQRRGSRPEAPNLADKCMETNREALGDPTRSTKCLETNAEAVGEPGVPKLGDKCLERNTKAARYPTRSTQAGRQMLGDKCRGMKAWRQMQRHESPGRNAWKQMERQAGRQTHGDK